MGVTNGGDNTVTRLESPGSLSKTFPVGRDPFGIAFDGQNMWIANLLDNTVTNIRASDGSNLGTFPVGSSPHDVAFDGANIWVTNNGSANVTKLRASDGANQGTFSLGNAGFTNPTGIAFDGANIWVATAVGVVVKLRASDGTVLTTVGVGGDLRGVAFDGANIWRVDSQLPRITKYSDSPRQIFDTAGMGNP